MSTMNNLNSSFSSKVTYRDSGLAIGIEPSNKLDNWIRSAMEAPLYDEVMTNGFLDCFDFYVYEKRLSEVGFQSEVYIGRVEDKVILNSVFFKDGQPLYMSGNGAQHQPMNGSVDVLLSSFKKSISDISLVREENHIYFEVLLFSWDKNSKDWKLPIEEVRGKIIHAINSIYNEETIGKEVIEIMGL